MHEIMVKTLDNYVFSSEKRIAKSLHRMICKNFRHLFEEQGLAKQGFAALNSSSRYKIFRRRVLCGGPDDGWSGILGHHSSFPRFTLQSQTGYGLRDASVSACARRASKRW